MREVAWVIFDEIHYMRDKGKQESYSHVDESIAEFLLSLFRTRGRMGGDHHFAAAHRPICLPISHDSKQYAIRRVDLRTT